MSCSGDIYSCTFWLFSKASFKRRSCWKAVPRTVVTSPSSSHAYTKLLMHWVTSYLTLRLSVEMASMKEFWPSFSGKFRIISTVPLSSCGLAQWKACRNFCLILRFLVVGATLALIFLWSSPGIFFETLFMPHKRKWRTVFSLIAAVRVYQGIFSFWTMKQANCLKKCLTAGFAWILSINSKLLQLIRDSLSTLR